MANFVSPFEKWGRRRCRFRPSWHYSTSKGQLIWKGNIVVFNSSKNELENFNFCPGLLGQKFLIGFFKNWKKSPLEINWPLLNLIFNNSSLLWRFDDNFIPTVRAPRYHNLRLVYFYPIFQCDLWSRAVDIIDNLYALSMQRKSFCQKVILHKHWKSPS